MYILSFFSFCWNWGLVLKFVLGFTLEPCSQLFLVCFSGRVLRFYQRWPQTTVLPVLPGLFGSSASLELQSS
jgi:hypothetical protein